MASHRSSLRAAQTVWSVVRRRLSDVVNTDNHKIDANTKPLVHVTLYRHIEQQQQR
jgi:hypothetical protein